MPFDQLRNVTGDYVQMSDGTCLDDMILHGTAREDAKEKSETIASSSGMSIEVIEEIVVIFAAVVLIGGLCYGASKLLDTISE